MNILYAKLKEILFSVLPITIFALILGQTISPMTGSEIFSFLRGSLLVILGLTIFIIGVDLGISPIGRYLGASIVKSNKVWVLVLSGLFLGFMISIAEPALHILAGEVQFVTGGSMTRIEILVVVSVGLAIMLSLGFIRMVYNISLKIIFAILYGIILVLGIFAPIEIIAIAFDASGATTGTMTVPFILALAIGISAMRKDSKAAEAGSFGLLGVASAGAIISVLFMSVVNNTTITSGDLGNISTSDIPISMFQRIILTSGEVLMALLPIMILFIVLQKMVFNLSKNKVNSIFKGLVYAYVGLVLFLIGVNTGFMDIGREVGYQLASMDNKLFLIVIGFFLGLTTILAEPAVYVLTHQIEEVTSGYVTRKSVLTFLGLGVGFAIAFSMIRIVVPGVQLWHFLLPGYLISLGLMYFIPELFVGIAFDSGGVASGPMTATFILAFTQGAADAVPGADILLDGFGMIAMVAMTPIIALQILGLIFKIKSGKVGVSNGKQA